VTILSGIIYAVVGIVLVLRAVRTLEADEIAAAVAQAVAAATYLTLLERGTLPWVVLFSTAAALQSTFLPTRWQRRTRCFYPDGTIHYVNGAIALVEIGIWALFQIVR
jgi:hypothetical protein